MAGAEARLTAPDGTPGASPVLGRGFGHGKLILIGEHAVVYGYPALAAGIGLGIMAEATAGTGRLTIPAWSVAVAAGDDAPPARGLAAILARLNAHELDFHLDAQVPPQAGLGSSAAMAVAIARAAAQAVRDQGGAASDADITAAVADAEAVFHGAPSGIDGAAAMLGGVGRFRRGEGWRPVPVLQSMAICVGLTGKPRDTAAQVAAVARLRERMPVLGKALALFDDLVSAGERALAVGDVDGLGRLFDVAHGLLASLRVSSAEIETMVHGARAAGAVGAKLTGAGGGGAVIALAPGHEKDVLRHWKRDGFDGFITEIGDAQSRPSANRTDGHPVHRP
ncbi:MAG TPA: mevalonate kinase [Polyangia bacterium]|jgi:mevalonate kinase|nr:mevalonate kinase [Polyangia bacterium]